MMEYNHRSKIIRPWDGTSAKPVPDLPPDVYFPTLLEDEKLHNGVLKAMDLSARVEDLWAALPSQLDEDLIDLMLQCQAVGAGLAMAHEAIMAVAMRLNHENWSTEIVVPNAQGAKFSYRFRPFASGGQFHMSFYNYQPRNSASFVVPSMAHVKAPWDTSKNAAKAGAMVDQALIMTNRAPEHGCMCWQFFKPALLKDFNKFAEKREQRERWIIQHFCTKLDLSRLGIGDAPLMVYEDLEAITNLLRMNHELMVTCVLELYIRTVLTKAEQGYLPTGHTRTGRPVAHKRFASVTLDPHKHMRVLTENVMLVPLGIRYEPWTVKSANRLRDESPSAFGELMAGASYAYPELLLWQRRSRDTLPMWDYRRQVISGIDKRRETVYTGRSRAGG